MNLQADTEAASPPQPLRLDSFLPLRPVGGSGFRVYGYLETTPKFGGLAQKEMQMGVGGLCRPLIVGPVFGVPKRLTS